MPLPLKRILPLFPAVVILAVFSPFLLKPRNHGAYDWGKELFDASVARESLVIHHAPPLWNSFCGGGNPLLGNPETSCASPFFALVVLMGAPLGLKLSIIAHALLGAFGMALLARDRGLSRGAATFVAALWPLLGSIPAHLAVGHVQWQTGYLLPLVLQPWLSNRPRFRPAILGFALMLLGGGVHIALIALLGMGVLAATRAWRGRSLRPLAALLLVLLLAAAVSGVKLLPSLSLLQSEPHRVAYHQGYNMRLLVRSLLMPASSPIAPDLALDRGEGGGYWEYAAYMGLLLLPFLLVAALEMRRKGADPASIQEALRDPSEDDELDGPCRRPFDLIFLAAAGLLLALDLPWWMSPWDLLHRIPPYWSERRPSRFILLLLLAVILLAARGFDSLKSRRPRQALLLAILAIVDLGVAARGNIAFAVRIPPPVIREQGDFVLRRGGSPYGNFLAGAGTIPCRQGLHLPQRAIAKTDGDYQGEAFVVEQESGTPPVGAPRKNVTLVSRAGNRFAVRYRSGGNALVVLNQNDDGRWLIRGGTRSSWNGLIAASVGPGSGTIRFQRKTRVVLAGFLVTVAGIALTLLLGGAVGGRFSSLLLAARH